MSANRDPKTKNGAGAAIGLSADLPRILRRKRLGRSATAGSNGGELASDWKSEEDVKFKFLVPYLEERGYKQDAMSFNVSVEVQEGRKTKTIFADLVVYASAKKDTPLVLCETKAPNEVLDRAVREQAISYARLLPKIVPLTLITNGAQVQVFQTVTKTRISSLPKRKDLQKDVVNLVIGKDIEDALRREAKHDLFIIDDVQTFKKLLRSSHNEIRNNEGYDPTVAFDELSKVLFCKMFEERRNPDNNRFRVAIYDDTMDKVGMNVVRKIFDDAKGDSVYGDLFTSDSSIELQDRTIRKMVSLFENYDLSLTAFDVKGEAFEYFLSDTFTGGLGEYFTPRNIVEFMVDAMDPKIGETIIDPFSGTGGFLIYAFDVVSEKIRLQDFSDDEKARWKLELSNRSLFGTDWKERTSLACKMNMVVHGDGSAGVFKAHGLLNIPGSIEDGKFDLCLTNPPFGAVENEPDIIAKYELSAGKDSQDRLVLAIERALNLVKPGGRIAIVVIDGLLDNFSAKFVRDYVKQHAHVRGVISLNKETFEGYGAKAKTSILFLEKKAKPDDDGTQSDVFMAMVRNTGYAPNGAPVTGNELPDVLLDWKAFCRGEYDPESRHADTWVAKKLGDRLDAKFYSPSADFLASDVEAARGDIADLISQTQKGLRNLNKNLDESFSDVTFETMRIDALIEEVQESEKVAEDKVYALLGVKWWGLGTFIREEKLGREIKGKTLYRVRGGRLIYNRLFAFRGSFALVPPEHDACYVSNEFPTFVAKKGVAAPDLVIRYLVHCLNSPQYLAKVDVLSTGSTKESRNRFNQRMFVDFTVEIPSDPKQLRAVIEMLDQALALRARQEELLALAKEMRDGVAMMLPVPM
jgi:type I restriction enzyme M protein